MTESEVLTKGDFAKLIRVSPSRVSQYIAAGQIHGDALVGEGHRARIRIEVAKAQLREVLDPSQLAGNGLETRLAPGAAAGRAGSGMAQAVDPIEERIKRERLEALQFDNRRRAEEEAARQGRYVLAEDAERAMGRALTRQVSEFEGALSGFSNKISAQYQLPQREILHLLRTEFRDWREQIAAKLQQEADSLPKLVEHDLDQEIAPDEAVD